MTWVQLAKATEGLTGSEIENAFVEALYVAFDQGKEPTDLTIADALTEFVPLLFRFTLFWEKSILIIKEVREGRIKIIEEAERWGLGLERRMLRRTPMRLGDEPLRRKEWNSEQEGLFAAVRWQAQTHLRRTLGAFDGQLQDQQSLVQAVVVELRRPAQRFGDEAVSDFKLFEDGKVQ